MYILLTGFIIDMRLTLLTIRRLIQTVEGIKVKPDPHEGKFHARRQLI
jgi:hypothetical protein